MRPVGYVLLGVLIVQIAFMFERQPGRDFVNAVPPLIILVGIWAVLLFSPVWNVRRKFRQRPDAFRPTNVQLDDAGIRIRSTDSEAVTNWARFISAAESPKSFLLYPSPMVFNIIPKRVLSAEQIEELRALISRHLKIK